MKKTFLFVLLCLMAIGTQATTVTYTVDNNTIFPNPERGFLHQATRHANKDYRALNGRESELKKHATKDQGTLILVLYYLDEFRKTNELPKAVFDGFEADMDTLRKKGMKAIVRIAYAEESYGEGKNESAKDASLSVIKEHLSQYKPYWKKHSDVIFCFQAGFVGQYGEWYYTDNFGNHVSKINKDCKDLLTAALAAIPEDRCLLLRRPIFKQQYLDSIKVNSAALNKDEAFKGTPKARLGHFNDAFLYNEDNMGTYSSTESTRKAQKKYIADETLFVPIGGETDITDEKQAKEQATYDKTIAEMSTMHWTFIKSSYSETVTDMWRKPENGTFDELNRRLGYRYQLLEGYYSSSVAQGAQMTVQMNIKNVGFAPLYNFRKARIVLKNGSYTKSIALKSDPRTWKPNGVITNIDEKIDIPADMPTGTYQLYLHLPDTGKLLKNKPAYAIRFANKNMWDEATGMNNLNASVKITSGSSNSNYIATPATLTKSNVASVSSDMTYYENNYFDFGPKSVQDQTRWAEWNVNVKTAGEYTVTTVGNYPNGHQWQLEISGTNTICQMPKSYKQGTVTETATWNLPAGNYKIRIKNILAWGQPKLLSVNLTKAAPSAIALPATLNIANMSEVSEDMTYENNYFDFGPKSVQTQTRWAEWQIQVSSSGNYNVAIEGNYPNGHQWQMELVGTNNTCTLPATWASGVQTENTTWNLSSGIYTLRIKNIMEWGQPKLKSITLTGAANHKPQAIDEVQDTLDQNAPMYDIMGRRVDASYKGIVIQNNKKYLLW